MKTSTQQVESANTPGIFQPVFSGSIYGQPFVQYGSPKSAVGPPISRLPSVTLPAGSLPSRSISQVPSAESPPSAVGPINITPQPAVTPSTYEPSFSLFGSDTGQDSWNMFSASVGNTAASPEIGAVNMDFANELTADGLADSLLNNAAAVAAQPVISDAYNLPLERELTAVAERTATTLWSSSTCDSPTASQISATTRASSSLSTSDTSSTASSSPCSSNRQLLACSPSRSLSKDEQVPRPELSEAMIEELNDISEFKNDEKYQKHLIEYRDKISFPIGEGGRELLRACLNVKGCKGRQLQGASVPVLLQLAHQWNLWDVALRIKIERQTGQLSPSHDAFVRFKANQSLLRKSVRKEYMVTERDQSGKIARIHYDETRKIKLGKDGRESLRAKLRRLHDKHANRMDELLAQHGFKYSELRNATVQQLGRMAFVCNLWDQVVSACRSQEEKRDGRGGSLKISPTKTEIKLPQSLINEPIITDENGQMSNDDARRTMEAVSELLQQSYGERMPGEEAHGSSSLSPDIFNSSDFSNAFGGYADHSHISPHNIGGEVNDLIDVKQEPREDEEMAYEVSWCSMNSAGVEQAVCPPVYNHLI